MGFIYPTQLYPPQTHLFDTPNKHLGKHAKMQRSKESQTGGTKQDKHINITQSGERCESSTPTPQKCISQMVTSKQALRRTYVTTQASGPKDQQTQNHGGHKA